MTVNRAVETKQTILREARRLFATHGFDAASMRDIAARSGITEAAIYHHFGSKRLLYEAAMPSASPISPWDSYGDVEALVEGLIERRRVWRHDAAGIALTMTEPIHPDVDRARQRMEVLRQYERGVASVLDRTSAGQPQAAPTALRMLESGTTLEALLRFGSDYGTLAFTPAFERRQRLLIRLYLGLPLPRSELEALEPLFPAREGWMPAPAQAGGTSVAGLARTGRAAALEARRGRLIDIALRRFANDGVENTTMKAIGAEEGISDAGVCYYFGTKQALVDAVLTERCPPPFEPSPRAGGSAALIVPERLVQLGEELIAWAARYPHWLRLAAREALRSEHARRLRSASPDRLRRTLAAEFDGRFTPELTDLLSDSLVRLFRGLGIQLQVERQGRLVPEVPPAGLGEWMSRLVAVAAPLDRFTG